MLAALAGCDATAAEHAADDQMPQVVAVPAPPAQRDMTPERMLPDPRTGPVAPTTPPNQTPVPPKEPTTPPPTSTQPAIGPLQDTGFAVAVDEQGNVFVAGSTAGALDGASSRGSQDGFVAKWSANGERLWTQQYGSDRYDFISAIALTPDGDIVVAGRTSGQVGQEPPAGVDAFFARLDPEGSVRWIHQFGGEGLDFASAVAVADDDTIFVASVEQQEAGAGQATAALTCFDGEGNQRWRSTWGGTPGAEPTALAARDDSVYVVGRANVHFDPHFWSDTAPASGRSVSDAFVRRYDASGQLSWEHTFQDSDTSALAVAISEDGGAVVAGTTFGQLGKDANAGAFDAYLSAFSASGDPTWTTQLGTAGWDDARGIAVLPDGDLIVIGGSAGDFDGDVATGYGAWIMRCDPRGGARRWVKQAFAELALAVAVDDAGASYATGWQFNPTQSSEVDAYVARFESDGESTLHELLGSAAPAP